MESVAAHCRTRQEIVAALAFGFSGGGVGALAGWAAAKICDAQSIVPGALMGSMGGAIFGLGVWVPRAFCLPQDNALANRVCSYAAALGASVLPALAGYGIGAANFGGLQPSLFKLAGLTYAIGTGALLALEGGLWLKNRYFSHRVEGFIPLSAVAGYGAAAAADQ